MPDNLSAADRLKTMRAVRSKNTGLERTLFAMLAGMHLSGWRKNVSDIIGKPDVVFQEQRVVVFVDGCFWHGCPECQRKLPATNAEYWTKKIERNIQRDRRNQEALAADGWKVLRIWEHELVSQMGRMRVRERLHLLIHTPNNDLTGAR